MAGGANGFGTKLDSAGKLVYSTYLGGANADAIQALAVDSNRIAYLTGSATSPDFPTTSGALQTAGPQGNKLSWRS